MDNLDNIYDYEMNELDKTIKEMDDLYSETKTHFDQVKNSGHQRSLSFIHLQTSNLISLKNAKASMLKDRANLKKVMQDFKFKEKNNEDAGESNGKLLQEMYKMIINSPDIKTANGESEEFEENEENDVDLDNLLDKRLSELNVDTDSQNYQIAVQVIDKKWKFVAINETGKILKGKKLPTKKDFKIKIKKIDGEKVAIDQNDKIYKLI